MDKIKIYVLESFQIKIIKFLIKKEFEIVEKIKTLEKEKTWMKKIFIDKTKFCIKKKTKEPFLYFQKKSFMPWNNPKNWSPRYKSKKEDLRLEKSQKNINRN